jgi:5'-methylthioadenosine phosphorylase
VARPVLGVIGGSGLYDLPGLTNVRSEAITTPFGDPSDAYVTGELGGTRLVFLPRHGKGHRLLPGEINYRANVHGMKQLGVTHLLSVSAVGSMREDIAPGHLVLVDQFIDRTFSRPRTFFGDGVVAHVGFADPTCGAFRKHLEAACYTAGAKVHAGGTYLCIEGPHFSTRAESLLYRSWSVDVIGMTALPEVKLAREAELCYATLALATDYDCWHDSHEAVTVEAVLTVLQNNAELAREVVRNAALAMGRLGEERDACAHALDFAVMTSPALIPPASRERLKLLFGGRFQAQ